MKTISLIKTELLKDSNIFLQRLTNSMSPLCTFNWCCVDKIDAYNFYNIIVVSGRVSTNYYVGEAAFPVGSVPNIFDP